MCLKRQKNSDTVEATAQSLVGFLMKKFLTIFLLILPIYAQAQCWSHYRNMTIADHIKEYPLSGYKRWVHYESVRDGKRYFAVAFYGKQSAGVEISSPLHYTGELRPITDLAREALLNFGGEQINARYAQELRVKEKGFDGWVLVQNVLYEPLQRELKKGDSFTACLVLIGVIREQHLYLMNEFFAMQDDKKSNAGLIKDARD